MSPCLHWLPGSCYGSSASHACCDVSQLSQSRHLLLFVYRAHKGCPSPVAVKSQENVRRSAVSTLWDTLNYLTDRCVCVCVPERLPVRIRACGREPGDPEDVWFSAQSCSTAAEGSVTVKRTTQLKVNAPAMLRFFLCVCFVSPSRTGVGGVQSIFPFKKQIRVKHVLKVYWSKIKGEWNTHVHTFSSGSDLED